MEHQNINMETCKLFTQTESKNFSTALIYVGLKENKVKNTKHEYYNGSGIFAA